MRSSSAASTAAPPRFQIPPMPQMALPLQFRRMPSGVTLPNGSRPRQRGETGGVRLALGLKAAALHRRRLREVTFIGVTGSSGKTTTKELIAAALRSELRGRATPAQGNGLAVLAKTILRTTRRDAFCVAEVALWRRGVIAENALVLRPDIAVVTCVGTDHRSITVLDPDALRERSGAGAR